MHFPNLNKLLCTVFAASGFLISGNVAADTLSDLESRVQSLEAKASAHSETAFNPSITAFGNFLGCFSTSETDSQDLTDCPNTFFFREFELDIRSPIGPFGKGSADGVVILAFEQEAPGVFHADLEEAYINLKPGGFQLKVGRFLSSFGRINRTHTHDLPQMTMPLSVIHFLGGHGFGQDGFSADIPLPSPGESNALTLNAEMLFGNLFESPSPPLAPKTGLPKFMGRLSWFFDLGNGHDMDIGASALLQPNENGPLFQLYGGDFNYRWRPYILGDKRSFLFGGEVYTALNGAERYFDMTPVGGFAFAQLQFNQRTYLGARYSYDQGATSTEKLNTTAGVFLTYYTTEFLRFRAAYERVSNEASFQNGRDQFLFELNFIFGSHPAEPYWVNR